MCDFAVFLWKQRGNLSEARAMFARARDADPSNSVVRDRAEDFARRNPT